MREGQQQEASPIARASLRLIILAIVLGSLAASFHFLDRGDTFHPATMRAWIQGAGTWGGLLFVVTFSCLQPLGLRAVLFLLSAPLIWSPLDAFLWSWAGAVGTAMVSFFVARFVARDWIQRRMPNGLRKLDDRLSTRGLRTVLLLRLLFYTTPALQYALGVSRVAFKPFLVGTILGVVPFTLAMTLAGHQVGSWLGRHPMADWTWAELGPWIVVAVVLLTASGALLARRWRRGLFASSFMVALLLFTQPASAEVSCNQEEAPELFVDLFASARVYPNADAASIGFAMGSVWRPTSKCVHLAGEGFARFGRRSSSTTAGDLKMRTAGGALGALWGNGDPNHWFGAGAMFDLGWARVGARNDFVLSGYARALLYWRLRKEFWVGLDARAGHVIVPVTVDGVGIKGPMVGLGIGAMWGEGAYEPK